MRRRRFSSAASPANDSRRAGAPAMDLDHGRMPYVLAFMAGAMSAPAWSADWVPLGVPNHWADAATVEHLDLHDRVVWVQYPMHARHVADMQKLYPTRDYSNYSYTVSKWQVNCNRKRIGVLHTVDYAGDGYQLAEAKVSKYPEMTEVIPGSNGEALIEPICLLRAR